MTLATTSIDYVPQERNLITDTMVRYLSTDTTCVRALFPDSLVRAQSEKWDPLVEWFFKTFNARLEVIRGFSGNDHPSETVDIVRQYLSHLDSWKLAAVHWNTSAAKSLVIGLALYKKHISIEQAVQAVRVDEEQQIKDWGMVEGNHDLDRLDMRVRLAAASVFVDLLSE
mmetsp:Transcript_46455/g.75820  ORF Transcript_46455/g.75820 Transcript_46455/m.75820 type:complete len:170 (+) Transcript_46455:467-976(+)